MNETTDRELKINKCMHTYSTGLDVSVESKGKEIVPLRGYSFRQGSQGRLYKRTFEKRPERRKICKCSSTDEWINKCDIYKI